MLNTLKRSSYKERIHVHVHIYCGEQSMPRIESDKYPISIYSTTEQNLVPTTQQESAKSLDLKVPASTEKEEKTLHTSFTENKYEQTKSTFIPTASRTAVSPPSKEDREKARRYWDNPRFGLSRLESATEFERMPLGESRNEKKQKNQNNGVRRLHWPSRNKP